MILSHNKTLIRMEGILKNFLGVIALNHVDMNIGYGEVRALIGENGAGKSTLMKILSGIHRCDDGKIIYKGQHVHIKNPHDALTLGIAMIHQELNHVPAMTVAENIFLGREPVHPILGIVNRKKMETLTTQILQQMDVKVSPCAKMCELSISEMQLVEIVKAISYKAELIIMDEPTSSLSGKEVEKLYSVIEMLKSKNVSVIYISHKLDEIFQIADTVTVLRDGEWIDTKPIAEINRNELIQKMAGRELKNVYPQRKANVKEIIFEVKNLNKHGNFSDIHFSLKKGEILGVYGLMGAGRTELAEALFGIAPADTGEIFIQGEKAKINSPQDAISYDIGFVPEDRKLKGLNTCGPVVSNTTIVFLSKICKYSQIIDKKEEKRIVTQQTQNLRIKISSLFQLVENLSGGNQQKIVLAKWLMGKPEILILYEPTRGIDVFAKTEIYKIMNDLVDQGMSIIMISSEIPEIMGMSDRLLVMQHGEISAEFSREHFNQEKIMEAALV